ncbi:kinase-like domain-containing protein [Fusarium oxysporum f. sp. albedinis]|nr:kinase-like domain-containing protein [Fusarium oxysporum f. sp. albedinis]
MPLQGLAVLSKPQSGHEHHLGSNHTKRRALRTWSNILSIWRGQAHMALLLLSQWNSNNENTVQLTSEQQGWRDSSAILIERYGKCREVVGRGKFGIVFVSRRKKGDGACEELYAVKKFKRQPKETELLCFKALLHPNVIPVCTLKLLKDTKGDYCEVMEFCSDSDLHSLVCSVGKLKWYEADCFFKLIMRGVEYIHEIGVAHLDLKPKHLLLTGDGLLKVSGFGRSECVCLAWEKDVHMVSGIRGSGPYIAPEEYTDEEFDVYAADIWAYGVIYMALITGCPLWRTAKKSEDALRTISEGTPAERGFWPHRIVAPSKFSGPSVMIAF